MRLSHRDFDALQRAILELYEYRDLESFRRAIPKIFLKVIPSDYFTLTVYRINMAARRATMMDCWESQRRITEAHFPQMERFVIEHPFTKYFMQGGAQTALKLSDFFTLPQFRDSALYNEVYRLWEIDHVLSVGISSGRGTAAAINVGGRGRDFTERDRLIMNLLRPHFNLAQRNAARATAALATQTRPLAHYGFTPREAEVVHWLVRGKSNPEMAIILGAKVRTVEKHMEHILEKLGVENRTAAAITATEASERERFSASG